MEEIFAILTEDLHQDLRTNQQETRLAKNEPNIKTNALQKRYNFLQKYMKYS